MRLLPPLIDPKYCQCRLNVNVNSLTFKNKLPENYVVCLQWWGEDSPCVISSSGIEYAVDEEQFETYLQLCQVLEFMIRRGEDSDVIGSSFLTNLTDILRRSTFVLPVVDYSGTRIGEMKVGITVEGTNVCNTRRVSAKVSHRKFLVNNERPEKPARGTNYGIAAALAKATSTNPVRFPYKAPETRDTTYFHPISLPTSPKAKRQDYGIAAALTKVKEASSVRFPYKRKRNAPITSSVTSPSRLQTGRVTQTEDDDILKRGEPFVGAKLSFHGDAGCPKTHDLPSSRTLYKETSRVEKTQIRSGNPEKVPTVRNLKEALVGNGDMFERGRPFYRGEQPPSNRILYKETQIPSMRFTSWNNSGEINNSVVTSKFSTLPKVLDYLLGKEMSEHEQRVALKYLQDVSPGEKLVTAVTECCERLSQSPGKSVTYSPKRLQERVFKLPLNKGNVVENVFPNQFVSNSMGGKCLPKQSEMKYSSNVKMTDPLTKVNKNYNVSDGNPKEFVGFRPNLCTRYDLKNPVEEAYCKRFLH